MKTIKKILRAALVAAPLMVAFFALFPWAVFSDDIAPKKQQLIREFNSIGGVRAEASMLARQGWEVGDISAYNISQSSMVYYVVVFERNQP